MIHDASFVGARQSRDNVASSIASSEAPHGDVVSSITAMASEPPQPVPVEDLLLRETNHRWSNDLQLVIGLLALQSKRSTSSEVRRALTDAMERISTLSRTRRAMWRGQQHTLDTALQQICEALHDQAELRSISIALNVGQAARGLSERHVTTLALVVNELTTNAIKHAFAGETSGHICISTAAMSDREVIVTVVDDGCPFTESTAHGSGVGMRLVQQLMASIGGVLILPRSGTKLFELRVPVEPSQDRFELRDQAC